MTQASNVIVLYFWLFSKLHGCIKLISFPTPLLFNLIPFTKLQVRGAEKKKFPLPLSLPFPFSLPFSHSLLPHLIFFPNSLINCGTLYTPVSKCTILKLASTREESGQKHKSDKLFFSRCINLNYIPT